MAVTKQAAQQFVDTLAARGIVSRLPDPKDARAKIITLTGLGKAMMTEANAVKRAIEADYRATLGDATFTALQQALNRLA